MSDALQTLRVVNPATHVGYMVINAVDYDEGVHELWDEGGDDEGGEVSTVPSRVAKGPRGRWYGWRGKERVTEAFDTAESAQAALERLEAVA